MQGSYSHGVSASAGTHDGGGAVDLSIAGMSEAAALRLVDQLRRRNGCAWLRTPKYGWPASAGGPHIHCIVRDEPGLSSGARQQVHDYDNHRNGLASGARDPHPRPTQHPFVMGSGATVALDNLKYGARNDDVRDLQRALTSAGFRTGVDGDYGPQTDASVIAHQKAQGWDPDPVGRSFVGPRQAARLGLTVIQEQ
jgi:hypothetical protein